MQFVVAKSASDPRWVSRGIAKSYDESKHPRDDRGRWAPKIPNSDDEIDQSIIDQLPPQARTREGARAMFEGKLMALHRTGQLDFYHEGPGDLEDSFRRKGIVSGGTDTVYAAINQPSGFVSGPKTVARFRIPRPQALSIEPDDRFRWSNKMSAEQLLLLEHPDLKGAYVSISGRNEIPAKWVEDVQIKKIYKVQPAASPDQVEQLLRQIDSLDPRLRREFLAAVRQIQNQVDLDRLATMLQQGRVDGAVQYLNTVVSDAAWARVAQEVSAGMLQAVRRMPVQTLTGLDVGFSVTNPKAVQFLQTYEGDLIRELTRDARAAVMEAIRAGVAEGRNPLSTARDVRSLIGLTQRQAQAVMNYRRALEQGDRGNALGRALRDKRFDSTVRRGNLASEKIDKLVERYSQRYVKYRSETIGRTESARAVSAGNHMRWKQMVADGKIDADQVTRSWMFTHDGKTRPAHREIPGMNPDGVGLDAPFQTSLGPLLFPGDPNGDPANTINCRCVVTYRFKLKPKEQSKEAQ